MPEPHCFVKPSLGQRWVQRIYRVGIDTEVKECSTAPLPEPALLSNPRGFPCCYRNNPTLSPRLALHTSACAQAFWGTVR